MHIDHSKLVELLVETSGLEKEKVENQLKDLLDEIKAAIEEGDAYEVDGLGVFSGIGNNVIFIPADELSTEINYKYVGMEPIEMDDATSQEEGPPQESEPTETDLDDEDPFAGLLDDVAETDEPRPDSSFELDMDEEADEDTSDDESAQDEEAPFDLDDVKESEADPDEEEKPGPDKWGIDTYKDDTAETMFSGLLGKQEEGKEDDKESPEEDHFNALFEQESEEGSGDSLLDEFTEAGDDSDDTEEALRAELEAQSDAEDDDDDEEDFDDPFEALAAENDEDDDEDDSFADEAEPTSSRKKAEEEEEVIPVIKNLSSEGAKKKRKEEEEKAEAFEPKKDKTKIKTPSDPKSQPVMLWVLLIILILGGGTYALGYFGIVNIPGVTPEPQMASTNTQTTPPATQAQPETPPQEQEQQTQEPQNQAQPEEPQEDTPAEEVPQDQEQEPSSQVSTDREVPANQSTYGMTGVPVSAANDGYTIVIYSLSRESSAKARENELSQEGYRVLLATVPSQQYGTLWRVSLGQFRTMRDAALAAEELESPFSESYFITKIQ